MKSNNLFIVLFMLLSTCFAYGQDYKKSAQEYLQRNAAELGIKPKDASSILVTSHTTSAHNGVTHVYVNQAFNEIPVYNKQMNLLILPNGTVKRAVGDFVSNLHRKVNTTKPQIDQEGAVRLALGGVKGQRFAGELQCSFSEVPTQKVIFKDESISLEDIEVELEYFPFNGEARLAWKLTIHPLNEKEVWDYFIDAVSGKVLQKKDRTIRCQLHGFAHGLSCAPQYKPAKAAVPTPPPPSSSYNVFPLLVESPIHGERAIVTEPWLDAPTASPFGWHDTNGEFGAEFTYTRGNNVRAQPDRFGTDPTDPGPDGGEELMFDFDLDLTFNPVGYTDASTTNLFYWCNIMHDVWYEYGFDEESGNFQQNNYNGSGVDDDPVIADAQDGSGQNNAAFFPSSDGDPGRIQMYEWGGGDAQAGLLAVTSPESIEGDFTTSTGSFGGILPPLSNPIEGKLVLVDDGSDTSTLGCFPLMNPEEIDGNIALVDRGDCLFVEKTGFAQDAGAIAIVICNNEGGAPFTMGGGTGDNSGLLIPAVMISQADCETIKAEMPDVRVDLSKINNDVNRDGSLDGGIISHEYGHGVSTRLTGGASTWSCLGNDEQAGEGWSDFIALVMITDDTHSGNEARGMGNYAFGSSADGPGFRTHPYSTNLNINPHTYDDIKTEAVPHGVGSVWCAMLWDLYWNLVDVYGFDNNLYTGTGGNNIAMQLMLDGLKLQPCEPGFVEARDAILLADELNNEGANQCLIWETFARRGLGFSADQGVSDSRADGTEAFDLPMECDAHIAVKKTTDATVLAGEPLVFTFEISNHTGGPIENMIVTDELPAGMTYIAETPNCAISEVDNVVSIEVGAMEDQTTIECSFRVEVDGENYSQIEYDTDVEEDSDIWSVSHGVGDLDWARVDTNPNSGQWSWFANDAQPQNDQYLVLDATDFSIEEEMMLTFFHHYNTEFQWDGGVVEISTDQLEWEDLGSRMIENGYNSVIEENEASAISLRSAFSGNSGGYIRTKVDLSDFAGEDIYFRFRMACDALVEAEGWYIDDITIGSIFTIENTACASADGGWENCSTAEVMVLQNDESSGLESVDLASGVRLFPNPTEDELNIELSDAGYSELKFSSLNGQILFTQKLAGPSTILDLSNRVPGVYLLELLGEKGSLIQKVVVK